MTRNKIAQKVALPRNKQKATDDQLPVFFLDKAPLGHVSTCICTHEVILISQHAIVSAVAPLSSPLFALCPRCFVFKEEKELP
jgi:hypothetical protein